MTPDRWRRIEEVLQAALDCAPHARAPFIDEACTGDEELKRETLSLVEAYTSSHDFLEDDLLARDARVLLAATSRINADRRLGRYKIVRLLGSGGMSDVYLAHDEQLGRPVALKILPAFFVADDARLELFRREARAASTLNHPNILTIHEVGEADGIHFIATEFVDGVTLRESMSESALSYAQVLDIGTQVAAALATAHEAGIVHRDVKPENIMRRRDGIVKVLDFGIAELTERVAPALTSEHASPGATRTAAGALAGTISYMSPEQARGFVVDARTDVWSLGIVLYEMLARRHPFKRSTRTKTSDAIIDDDLPPLDDAAIDAPTSLDDMRLIIGKALCKNRDERFASMAEMHDELKSLRRRLERAEPPASNDDGEARRVASRVVATTRTLSVRQRRDKRTQLSLLVASLILLTAVVGGMLYRSSQTSPAAIESAAVQSPSKPYRQMNDAERLAFISIEEQRISAMMGERAVKLEDEALREIKRNVDGYAARIDSRSDQPGDDDLRSIYSRAVPHLPLIARSFAASKVPVIVGIYLPMIESEYRLCSESAHGAKGMFQFLPQTAKRYGVAPEQMCDPEKTTPAAARYIADHMAELGDDSQSMTLVVLSYNRGGTGVRDALRRVRDVEGYRRNFWTLFAHRDKLGKAFNAENAHYVPRFFAAAIIGENPGAFELPTPPLSILIEAQTAAGTPHGLETHIAEQNMRTRR